MSKEHTSERVGKPTTGVKVALGVLSALVLLYSVLIATRPLLGVTAVVWLVGVYFLWRSFHLAARFVAAFERVADAMERQSPGRRDD